MRPLQTPCFQYSTKILDTKMDYLKVFSIFAVIISPSILAQEPKKFSLGEVRFLLKPGKDICLKKIGISEDITDTMYTSKTFDDSPEFQCFSKCILQIMAVVRDGKPSKEVFLKKIDTMMADDVVSSVHEVVATCFDKIPPDTEGCLAAYMLNKCVWQANEQFYLIPRKGEFS